MQPCSQEGTQKDKEALPLLCFDSRGGKAYGRTAREFRGNSNSPGKMTSCIGSREQLGWGANLVLLQPRVCKQALEADSPKEGEKRWGENWGGRMKKLRVRLGTAGWA